MIYRAQYEITDQDLHLPELTNEAKRRLLEDILKLGMVMVGESFAPLVIDVDGDPWIQIDAKVKPAGRLRASSTAVGAAA